VPRHTSTRFWSWLALKVFTRLVTNIILNAASFLIHCSLKFILPQWLNLKIVANFTQQLPIPCLESKKDIFQCIYFCCLVFAAIKRRLNQGDNFQVPFLSALRKWKAEEEKWRMNHAVLRDGMLYRFILHDWLLLFGSLLSPYYIYTVVIPTLTPSSL
jgi:hypothetical protein